MRRWHKQTAFFCSALGLIAVQILIPTANLREQDNLAWTQWRGPSRDGQFAGSEWPDRLTAENLKQLWRVELGPSYSGPIVAQGRVFVTETDNEKFEVVRALDQRTGAEIWQQRWEGAMKVPFFARSNGSWIRSTPAYDDGKLYVGGMRDVLVCLNAADGNVDWRLDFVNTLSTKLPAFGFVCSPLVSGPYLYVQAGAGLAKIDRQSGKILWQAMKDGGGMNGSAFSSPFLATIGGRLQLLVQSRTTLAGIDPDTGEELWSHEIPAFRGMNILTPTVFGDAIFTSSYGGKSLMLEPKGGEVVERWSNKAQGYMSTPVVIDGFAYLHLRNQRFTCLDLATGETKWTSKPYGKYCSLVANGHRILALDERGILLLIQATPKEFLLIDSLQVSENETWAHLAVSDRQLFIRELNALSAYAWE